MNIQEFRQHHPEYANRSDEDLTRALHKKYYEDKPFEEFSKRFRGEDVEVIDTDTGTPLHVRAFVGKETDPTRKRQILERLYPGGEVKPYGEDNFTYVNPETGKRTAYNPSGFDAGDVAEYGREIAQVGTGIVTAPASLTGVGAVGSAAATAGAGAAYDYLLDALMNTKIAMQDGEMLERHDAGEAAKKMGMETGMGYLGGVALGGAAKGIGKALDPVKQELVQAWKSAGQKIPSLGAVSDSKAVQLVEQTIGDTIGGTNVMNKARESGRAALKDSLDDAANRLAPRSPESIEGVGQMVIDESSSAKAAWRKSAQESEDKVFGLIGNNPSGLSNTLSMVNEAAATRSPEAAEALIKSLRKTFKNELKDFETGDLNINTLRALRTKLNNMIKQPSMTTTTTPENAQLMAIRDALAKDIDDAIVDPAQKTLYRNYMQEYAQKKVRADALAKMLETGGKAKDVKSIGNMILNPNISSQQLSLLKEQLGDEAFNKIRASVIKNLGRGSASISEGQASPASMMTKLGTSRTSYTPESQALLFGEDIAAPRMMAEGLDAAGDFYNASRTGAMQQAAAIITSPVKLIGQGAIAAIDPATAILAPYGLAKANTSQRAINMLANPRWSKFMQETMPRIGGSVGRPSGLLGARQMENK